MKQWIPIFITLPMLASIFLSDIRFRRIPNSIIGLSIIILYPMLFVFSRLLNEPASFSRAINGSVYAFLFFLSLHAINPAGLGLGDVKLAGILGASMTWDSFDALFYGVMIMFLAAALFSVFLILRNRRNIKASIPFAPFMIIGSLFGILAF